MDKFLDAVRDGVELAGGLMDAGAPRDAAIEFAAETIDQLVDWRKVIHGKVGVAIERLDGKLIRAAIRIALKGLDR